MFLYVVHSFQLLAYLNKTDPSGTPCKQIFEKLMKCMDLSTNFCSHFKSNTYLLYNQFLKICPLFSGKQHNLNFTNELFKLKVSTALISVCGNKRKRLSCY
jgi:hypothetical protein